MTLHGHRVTAWGKVNTAIRKGAHALTGHHRDLAAPSHLTSSRERTPGTVRNGYEKVTCSHKWEAYRIVKVRYGDRKTDAK